MKTLSLGSGFDERNEDTITLDIAPETNPDVVWNLNEFPYPFEDDSFDQILMYDVIEHIDNIIDVMNECYRIMKKGGLFHITTPHFSSANSYTDPTHQHHLGYYSFDFFDPDHERFYYSKARFSIQERYLYFDRRKTFKKILERWANKNPWNYEQKWCWILPSCYLDFKLRKV